MYEDGEYSSSAAAAAEADCYTSLDTFSTKKKNKNKRRFSDDQIKSLEVMFESDTKLEPRKKLQVARELGLQPRQVAIWFQNKRARYKSKQLERDYNKLRSNYNTLAAQFDTLKKEKQSLVIQLQRLHDMMENSGEQVARNSTAGKSDKKSEFEMKAGLSLDRSAEPGFGVLSDDDSSIKAEYFGLDDEPDLLNMVEVEPGDGSLTSTEDWGTLESDGLLDQSTSSYQWWDFWS